MRAGILGVERRRKWDDDEMLAIVSTVGVGGATVTQIGQRHEIIRPGARCPNAGRGP